MKSWILAKRLDGSPISKPDQSRIHTWQERQDHCEPHLWSTVRTKEQTLCCGKIHLFWHIPEWRMYFTPLHHVITSSGWMDDYQTKTISVKDENLLIWMGGERRRETWEMDWSNQNSAETSLCIPKTSVWAWPMGFSVTAAVSGLSLFSPTLSRRTMLLHFSRWRRRGGSHLPTQSHQWPLTWRVMQTLSQTGHGWNTSNTPWMQLWLLTSISALKAAEVFFSYLPGVLCTRIHVA